MPAVAIAVEPVSKDEALAAPALPQADDVALREAAAKRYQFLSHRVAGTIGFVRFAQAFSKGKGDGLGHRGYV
jgi:hypothetical protein